MHFSYPAYLLLSTQLLTKNLSIIQSLPLSVINLIAAGEVIDSLAAVVRELAENSVDAGATRITISVWSELWRVQVADNGSGITLNNLRQAAAPHSTSKIYTLEDIWQITTLGFRGEALHSLAQVSQLEIASRPQTPPAPQTATTDETSIGWRFTYQATGTPEKTETTAIAPGTIVTVTDLFGNWPVRRQGLPSFSQQLRLIQLTIQQMALCFPQITWQVRQNDKPYLQISPGQTPQDILPQILRGVHCEDLQYLETPLTHPQPEKVGETSPTLELLLGLPDRCHRGRPDWVKVALNGRVVRSPELEQTIIIALSRTCPRDRYPICFVHLHLVPSDIDWNRHPAKAEVYLHHLGEWQRHITTAIEQALRLSVDRVPVSLFPHRVQQVIKASEDTGNYQTRTIQAEPTDGETESLHSLELRVIAQVHQTYIMAEHPNGIWLIEQHIAHERVLYEQLCAVWELVPREPPILLEHLSLSQLEQLQQLGLEVDPFGEQLWAVRTVPGILAQRPDCAKALIELSLGGDVEAAKVATACRSAIRNGVPLTLEAMQTLINQWQRTRYPRTCPHGRPIFLRLEESALARFFKRHWVLGKSHGI